MSKGLRERQRQRATKKRNQSADYLSVSRVYVVTHSTGGPAQQAYNKKPQLLYVGDDFGESKEQAWLGLVGLLREEREFGRASWAAFAEFVPKVAAEHAGEGWKGEVSDVVEDALLELREKAADDVAAARLVAAYGYTQQTEQPKLEELVEKETRDPNGRHYWRFSVPQLPYVWVWVEERPVVNLRVSWLRRWWLTLRLWWDGKLEEQGGV